MLTYVLYLFVFETTCFGILTYCAFEQWVSEMRKRDDYLEAIIKLVLSEITEEEKTWKKIGDDANAGRDKKDA